MIMPDGCWAEFRVSSSEAAGRPCVFLDRDGVLIEDTGYPHRPDAVILVPETLESVAAVCAAGAVAGIVSNQSGIGRGLFGWEAFAAVQTVIDAALAQQNVRLAFVLACPHHPEAALKRFRADHPWRKPKPGMLQAAATRLDLASEAAAMVGDRASDMEAAAAAGVGRRFLLGKAVAPAGSEAVRRSDLCDRLIGFCQDTGTRA